jgi:thioredoxin reductase (NADPH)
VELDMKSDHDQIGGAEEATLAETFLRSLGPDFRWELAFPELTEDMVERLRAYGSQETFTTGTRLYSHGDCWIDMFVVLEGEVSIFLRSPERDAHVFVRHRKLNFTGEFNLLNSQGAVVEARTSAPSTLLRISRPQLQRLMHAEGDIANVIVAACI